MASDLDRLLRLWREPPGDGPAAEAAFREVYADPVRVNGAELPVAALVERARALHRAYQGIEMELVDRVETPDRLVIGFWMRARHVGPLETPLGTVQPTSRAIEARTTDILTLRDGLITDVWVVSDELGVLLQLGALRLA
jgi:hypothetical protein